MFTEKRAHPRINLNLPIKLSDSGADFDIVTETGNISASGAYCAVNKEILPMTKLKIILLIPVKKSNRKTLSKIECRGIVVHSTPSQSSTKYTYNIGIFFNDIDEKDRKTILLYVTSHDNQNS